MKPANKCWVTGTQRSMLGGGRVRRFERSKSWQKIFSLPSSPVIDVLFSKGIVSHDSLDKCILMVDS